MTVLLLLVLAGSPTPATPLPTEAPPPAHPLVLRLREPAPQRRPPEVRVRGARVVAGPEESDTGHAVAP